MLETILASVLSVAPAPQDPTEATVLPELRVTPTAATFAAWREHLLPAEDELRWETIPWQVTFAEGLAEASAQRRPLLFWGMNGHPLGCT